MKISKQEAIIIIDGIITVDTQGEFCDSIFCAGKCFIQESAKRVKDTNFDAYAWGDLVSNLPGHLVMCVNGLIVESARKLQR